MRSIALSVTAAAFALGGAGASGASHREQGGGPSSLEPLGRDIQAAGRENLAADDGWVVAPDGGDPFQPVDDLQASSP